MLGGDDSPEGKQKRLDKGMASGVSAANRFASRKVGVRVLKPLLSVIGKRYGLQVLEPVPRGANWDVHGEVQRTVAPSEAQREDVFAPGAYESIDPNERTRENFQFKGDGHVTKVTEAIFELDTEVILLENKNVKARGRVNNRYDRNKQELTLSNHFLDAIPKEKRWIEAPEKPIVPGRGTPLIAYVNLRQMKKFEEQAGAAAVRARKGELREEGKRGPLDPAEEARLRKDQGLFSRVMHVKLENIQNVRALLELYSKIGVGDRGDIQQAIQTTHSIPYVRSFMLQAGSRIKSVEVVDPASAEKIAIGELMTNYEEKAPKSRKQALIGEHEELLRRHHVTRQTIVLYGFDVKLTMSSLAGRDEQTLGRCMNGAFKDSCHTCLSLK